MNSCIRKTNQYPVCKQSVCIQNGVPLEHMTLSSYASSDANLTSAEALITMTHKIPCRRKATGD